MPETTDQDIRLVTPETDFGAGKCRHFGGSSAETCKAGVRFADVMLDHDPISYRYAGPDGKAQVGATYTAKRSSPCLDKYNFGGATCPKREPFTPEEVAERRAKSERSMDLLRRGLSSCCEAEIDERSVIREGRHKGHGPRYCSKCGKIAFLV